jgi:cytochrome P450
VTIPGPTQSSSSAYPLPITVICELVGVPEEDHPLWREWSETMVSSFGPSFADAVRDMVAYIQELIERRRAEPTGDLISGLIQAQDEDGDRLSDTEMVTMIMTVVIAGHETTAHLIGNGTAALLTHPDQLALLLSDLALTPRAVHELLRWCGPALGARMRYATEDAEMGGETVRRGEAVMPSLVAANYDPRMFGDPRRLDITRVPDGRRETHVGFSHGMHYCLGARGPGPSGERGGLRGAVAPLPRTLSGR